MSDTVTACPKCDSPDLYHRTQKTDAYGHEHPYRCEACGAEFDTPETRPPRESAANTSTEKCQRSHERVRQLLDADPEEVGGD